MVYRKDVERKIRRLKDLYNASSQNAEDQILYSKGALMELCGWIEDSMDSIALRAVKGLLETAPYKQISGSNVSNVYGFEYKKYFRPMMISQIGVSDMELLEKSMGADVDVLKAKLESFIQYRGCAAHSAKTPSMGAFNDPSVILGDLAVIYPILRRLYSKVIIYNKARKLNRSILKSTLSI